MRMIDADGLPFMKADLTGLFDEKNPNPDYNLWEKGYQACLKNVQKQVNNAPTVDAAHVVHGKPICLVNNV